MTGLKQQVKSGAITPREAIRQVANVRPVPERFIRWARNFKPGRSGGTPKHVQGYAQNEPGPRMWTKTFKRRAAKRGHA